MKKQRERKKRPTAFCNRMEALPAQPGESLLPDGALLMAQGRSFALSLELVFNFLVLVPTRASSGNKTSREKL